MAKEIERKFLVTDNSYKTVATSHISIKQGYLNRDPERTVRVRIIDSTGFLTIKGKNHGIERLEFEYQIPVNDAIQLLSLCEGRIIKKTRWIIFTDDGHKWEVDEFHGELAPMVIAEIELNNASDSFSIPNFVGHEVSNNPAYYNSAL